MKSMYRETTWTERGDKGQIQGISRQLRYTGKSNKEMGTIQWKRLRNLLRFCGRLNNDSPNVFT